MDRERLYAALDAQMAACKRALGRLDELDDLGGVRVPVDRPPRLPPDVAHAELPYTPDVTGEVIAVAGRPAGSSSRRL